MIVAIEFGNIIEFIGKFKLDSIQNAANGTGACGRGIAGAIKQAGGIEIQNDAYSVCNKTDPQAGDAYSTISGSLKNQGIKRIIHAVTMKRPGGPTSYEIVEKAFKSSIKLAKEEGITRLGCTALGTGVGGLDNEKVGEIMYNIAKDADIDIVFVDFNEKFINTILECEKDEKITKALGADRSIKLSSCGNGPLGWIAQAHEVEQIKKLKDEGK